MGLLSQLLGVRVEAVRRDSETAHDTSTFHSGSLAELRVATELQNSVLGRDRNLEAIPAAYRGGQMLEDLSAQLPVAAVRGGRHSDQETYRPAERLDVTPSVLVDPSPFMDRDEAVRMSVSSMVWRGNAYWYLQNLDRDGRPRFATPVNPDEVACTWDDKRMAPQFEWRGERMVPGVNWLHIPMKRPPGQPYGLGPIDAARYALAGVADLNEWGRRFFTDSAVPSGFLSVPGKLTGDEPDQLRERWNRQHANGRGTAILSGGIEYKPISITPEQAQFLLTRAFGIQEVARLFGIPAHFLNAGTPPQSANSMTYTNTLALRTELTSMTLYPTYLRRIERAYSKLLPRGVSAVFDLSDFLKADDKTRYDSLKTALGAGILTLAEAREREDLPQIDDPDPDPAPPPEDTPVPERNPANA